MKKCRENRFRKAMSVLLSAVLLVVTVLGGRPSEVHAEEDAHVHNGVTYQPWERSDSLPTEAGNWYLTKDVTIRSEYGDYMPEGTTKLCLNGKTVSQSGVNHVVWIKEKGILHLYDCTDVGKICYAQFSGIRVLGKLYMYGGRVVSNRSNFSAGVFVSSGAEFYMYDGEISGNTTDGGTGGVVTWGSAFYMYGGKISGNTGSYASGAGIRENGIVTVGGNAVISGNSNKKGVRENFYLSSGETIRIDKENPLSGSASIGVTTRNKPTAEQPIRITTANDFDYSSYFFSDDENYAISDSIDHSVWLTVKGEHNVHVAESWSHDDDNHWKQCFLCGEEFEAASSHTFGEWVFDKEATEDENGERHRDCSICGFQEKETIPAGIPTATPVPTATVTPIPPASATPATATPIPPAPATPVPTATATPVPTATVTPIPTLPPVLIPTLPPAPLPTQPATERPSGAPIQTPPATEKPSEAPMPTLPPVLIPTLPPAPPPTQPPAPLPTQPATERPSGVPIQTPPTMEKPSAVPIPTQSATEKPTATARPGEASLEVEIVGNAPDTKVSITQEEVLNLILTEEDRQQLANGQDIRIRLVVTDISDSVSDKDKALAEASFGSCIAGRYLDISLYKQIGDTEFRITKPLAGRISIALTVPDHLKNTDSTRIREFAVVRVHNGAASMLSDGDSDADTVTVETDRFSTYVLVYKDTLVGGNNGNGNIGENGGNSPNNGGGVQTAAPGGDAVNVNNTVSVNSGDKELQTDGKKSSTIKTDDKETHDKSDSKDSRDKKSGGSAAGHTRDGEPKTGDGAPFELVATLAMISGLSYVLLYFLERRRGMTEETKKEIMARIIAWAKKGGRLRKGMAIAAIFVFLVYYHGIGKEIGAEWRQAYDE